MMPRFKTLHCELVENDTVQHYYKGYAAEIKGNYIPPKAASNLQSAAKHIQSAIFPLLLRGAKARRPNTDFKTKGPTTTKETRKITPPAPAPSDISESPTSTTSSKVAIVNICQSGQKTDELAYFTVLSTKNYTQARTGSRIFRTGLKFRANLRQTALRQAFSMSTDNYSYRDKCTKQVPKVLWEHCLVKLRRCSRHKF